MRQRVMRSLSMQCGARVLLYAWGHAEAAKLQNLVCLAADGTERWRAKLPDAIPDVDCFVALRQDDEQVIARTYSGFEMRLSMDTGHALETCFAA